MVNVLSLVLGSRPSITHSAADRRTATIRGMTLSNNTLRSLHLSRVETELQCSSLSDDKLHHFNGLVRCVFDELYFVIDSRRTRGGRYSVTKSRLPVTYVAPHDRIYYCVATGRFKLGIKCFDFDRRRAAFLPRPIRCRARFPALG